MKKHSYLFILSLFLMIQGSYGQKSVEDLGEEFMEYWRGENFDSTLILARELNKVAYQQEGDSSYWYALTTRYLGNVAFYSGNIDSAKYCFQLSLDLYNKYHPDDPDRVHAIGNLGVIYQIMGDYESAKYFAEQALAIRKKPLKDCDLDYGVNLMNLGNVNFELGEYFQAESHYKQALMCIKVAVGEDDPNYPGALQNLGVLYHELGDYGTAEEVLLQALEITGKISGEDHPDYARILFSLANTYTNIDSNDLALSYYMKSLAITEATYGKMDPECGLTFNNMGILYEKIGNQEDAEAYYQEALEIYGNTVGESHQYCAETLSNLAMLHNDLADYEESENYFQESMAIFEAALGSDHIEFVKIRLEYASFLTGVKRYDDAFRVYQESASKYYRMITDNFEWLNDQQKSKYWKKVSDFYEDVSEFAHAAHEELPESTGLNYNAALGSKSILLEAKISKEDYFYEIESLREELSAKRKYLVKLESDGSQDTELIQKLSREADSLDKLLTLTWPAYAEQKKHLGITWQQVRDNLDKDEAAIEFVRYRVDEDSVYQYLALLLRKEDKWPVLVPLCDEDQLTAVHPLNGFLTHYHLIWKPLEAYLEGIQTIYYSPVGELNNIPFQGLTGKSGNLEQLEDVGDSLRGIGALNGELIITDDATYLIDTYTLHQLTSTRYLAMGLKENSGKGIDPSIIMVGGVNYDYLPGNPSEGKKIKGNRKKERSGMDLAGLEYLEGTQKEVESISKTVRTEDWNSLLLEQNNATEENVTLYEGSDARGILHIATHGYAFPAGEITDSILEHNSFKYTYRFHPNPMVRSGLILAGGNWAWMGIDTLAMLGAVANGILTALEVSHLNLRKTRLVVLSACETGLGKIEESEGTFGLKRGFKLAGVEQIIVSLWKVPDRETKELMELFYEDLAHTLDPVSSFRTAQLAMREKYPSRPDLWAGFVLVR